MAPTLKPGIMLATALLLTACISHQQIPDSQRTQCLHSLAAQDNFSAQPGTLYTGVHDPILRTKLNSHFRTSAHLLATAIEQHASHRELINMFGSQINLLDRTLLDTEDAEQVASTYEKALDCLGFDSSEGILNRWMYG